MKRNPRTRYNYKKTGETMRFWMMSALVVAVLAGCSAKEINRGVDDGINDVKRVIRGTN